MKSFRKAYYEWSKSVVSCPCINILSALLSSAAQLSGLGLLKCIHSRNMT